MLEEIKATVKEYVLDEFLPGESPAVLTDSTPLITGGIVDSMGMMKLVTFLEERFALALGAAEIDVDKLNTISGIASVVRSKL